MAYLESQIKPIKPSNEDEKIITYKTNSHGGFITYDGIDVNGSRIADEIIVETDRLNKEGNEVKKFTILGFSLGGLISRYAIGVLHHKGYFDTITPVNFITFCTPHVGAIKPANSFLAMLFNGASSFFLAYSGAQLFLKDKQVVKSEYSGNKDHDLPLLVWMAEPRSSFYIALSKFKHRIVYANAINDTRASFFTAAITTMDPFNSMVDRNASAYDLEYVQGYEPTVIDIQKPITFSKVTRQRPRKPVFLKIMAWVRIFLSIILVTPLWSMWFLYKTIFERIKLNKRVSDFFHNTSLLHLYGYPDNIFEGYSSDDESPEPQKSPTKDEKQNRPHESLIYTLEKEFAENVRDETDDFVDSIFDAVNSQNYKEYQFSISKGSKKNGSSDSRKSNSFKSTISEMENYKRSTDPLLSDQESKLMTLKGKQIDSFRLNLSTFEVYIIHKLNMLSWEKYPVVIRNTDKTHSAAIVRQDEPDFAEGKTIVKHFVEKAFKLE